MNLSNLISHKEKLIRQIDQIRAQLKALPTGNLLCARSGNYIKWYLSNGHFPTYLARKERPLAEKLALRKYYTLRLDEQTQELESINYILDLYACIERKSDMLLADTSNYHDLLYDHFKSKDAFISNWQLQPYDTNCSHPEHLIHHTLSDHKVRSKSEVFIANSLFTSHIPYRYECALHCNEAILYPDFTILHPVTHKLIYWEHFGMIEQPSYSENAFNKLKIYAVNGIYPSINLITTYETNSYPLDSSKIQKLIDEFFL